MKVLIIFFQIFFNIIFFIQAFNCLKLLKVWNTTNNNKNKKLFNMCFLFSIISYIFYLTIIYNNCYDKVSVSIILLANAFLFSSSSIPLKKNKIIK